MTIFIILLIGFFLVWGWQALKNSAKRQERLDANKTDAVLQKEITDKYLNDLKEQMNHVAPDLDLALYLKNLYDEFEIPCYDHWTEVHVPGGYGDINNKQYSKKVRVERFGSHLEDTRAKIDAEEEEVKSTVLWNYKVVFEYSIFKNRILDFKTARKLFEESNCTSFESGYKINKIYASIIYWDDAIRSEKTKGIDDEIGLTEQDISAGYEWFLERCKKCRQVVDTPYGGPPIPEYYCFLEKLYEPSFEYSLKGDGYISRGISSFVEGDGRFINSSADDISFTIKIPLVSVSPPPTLDQKDKTIWERIHESKTAQKLFANLLYHVISREMLLKYKVKNLLPYKECEEVVEQQRLHAKQEFINSKECPPRKF